ncbi:MAG TPA: hypothetical protein VFZ53_18820 [Polyangiaceae bacterium]
MRKLAPLVPLPLLVALAAWGSARTADAGGVALGAALSAVADVLRTEQRPADDDAALDEPIPNAALAAPGLAEGSGRRVPGAKRGKNGQAQSPARSLFVSAETVLRLAGSRVTPKGVRVPASGSRPAGLSLRGVDGLGIGLRDGDVLTRALGQPALSSSAVVRAILVARSNRVRVLEGEFYRGSERWTLRVEQPYLDEERFARVQVTLADR